MSEGIGLIPEHKRGGANPNNKVKRSKIKCAVCNTRIPIVAAREGDKWCSSTCCRKAHGVEMP